MKKHQIKLIDGTYGVNESREVLFTLLNDKIRFLNSQIFSMEERGIGDSAAKRLRVVELQIAEENLKEQLAEIIESGLEVKIKCNIELEFSKAAKETAILEKIRQ
ncbi:MAG: hypothetical protein ACJA2S_003915 [Cyclobacteriaceae bacterium]|jgi:hypothetical protein